MQLPCLDAESLKAVVCIGPASTWCAIKKLLTHPASTLITSCLGLPRSQPLCLGLISSVLLLDLQLHKSTSTEAKTYIR